MAVHHSDRAVGTGRSAGADRWGRPTAVDRAARPAPLGPVAPTSRLDNSLDWPKALASRKWRRPWPLVGASGFGLVQGKKRRCPFRSSNRCRHCSRALAGIRPRIGLRWPDRTDRQGTATDIVRRFPAGCQLDSRPDRADCREECMRIARSAPLACRPGRNQRVAVAGTGILAAGRAVPAGRAMPVVRAGRQQGQEFPAARLAGS